MKLKSVLSFVVISIFYACLNRPTDSVERNVSQHYQPDSVTLAILLKSGGRISFNTYDVYGRHIELKNNDTVAAVVEKRLFVDKPLFMNYVNVLMIPGGEPLHRRYGMLLVPGDSLQLANTGNAFRVQHATGYASFIDSIITIPEGFYEDVFQSDHWALLGFDGVLQEINGIYGENEATIDALDMDNIYKQALRSLNTNIKYVMIARLIRHPTIARSYVTDSLYDEMLRKVDDFRAINAFNNGAIFGTIFTYNAKRHNKKVDTDDFWGHVAVADEELKQSGVFRDWVLNYVAGNFAHLPENMPKINKTLKSMRTQDPFLDTMYQLSNIMLETATDFKKAENDLNEFADGRFRFVFDHLGASANRELKTLKGLPAIDLYDFAGTTFDFRRIVTDNQYKLTVVDLWASWCVPCIGEMPHWERLKDKFKGKPIRFVTVSIDKESDHDKWITVAKREGVYGKPDQYRLANFKESPLTRLLNIREIPRYLVINANGDIVDDDFHRPSDQKFELSLLKILN